MSAKRDSNYITEEVMILIKIVSKYIHIIESKKFDGYSQKEKVQTWKRIEEEFNGTCEFAHREMHSLKNKYDNVKKLAKQKVRQREMLDANAAGGGGEVEFTIIDNMLLEILKDRISGHPSVNYDSDATHLSSENLPKSSITTEIANNLLDSNDNSYNTRLDDVIIKKELLIGENNDSTTEVVNGHKRKSPPALPPLLAHLPSHKRKLPPKKHSYSNQWPQIAEQRIKLLKAELEQSKERHEFLREEHMLKMEKLRLEIESLRKANQM